MNRIIVILSIFLVFASLTTSVRSKNPLKHLKRQDSLSGYKQCDGDYPNIITLYNYKPVPIIPYQNITVHMAGKATETVEPGALMTVTGYLHDKQLFSYDEDYCKLFIEQNGLTCPVEKGDFDYTATWFVNGAPSDPISMDVEYGFKVSST